MLFRSGCRRSLRAALRDHRAVEDRCEAEAAALLHGGCELRRELALQLADGGVGRGRAVVAAVVAAVSLVACVLGYAQFGDYVFSNSLATVLVLFAAWGLRQATHDIVVRVCDIESPAGNLLRDKLGADQPALRLTQDRKSTRLNSSH